MHDSTRFWAPLAGALAAMLAGGCLAAADWPGFRGPNGSGVTESSSLPVEFGPTHNLRWKTVIPQGASSPVVVAGRVFLTALDEEELVVLSFDARSGETLWRRVAPRPRREQFHPNHGAATPSPVSDGESLYIFFPEFGLLSYTQEGHERWRTPSGPFTSVQGLAGSPVVADGKVVLLIDQAVGAYMAAFDSASGKQVWKQARPTNFLGSYSTPIIYRPAEGPAQVIAAASMELTSYQLSTGERLWWDAGWLSPVSVPALGDGVVFVSEPVNQGAPAFSGMAPMDKDKDGTLSRDEAAAVSGLVHLVDRIDGNYGNGDGKVEADEWRRAFEAFRGSGGLTAMRLDAKGEIDEKQTLWRYRKSLPSLASILLYEGVLYTVRSGGIVTALDSITGEVLKQGRLREAIGEYYASPVASDGKVYFSSLEGKITVVSAGRDWEVLATNDLAEPLQATPAIAEGKLYVRSHHALYCFGTVER